MGLVSRSLNQSNLHPPQEVEADSWYRRLAGLARIYRLTLLFAATAVLVISIATVLVNWIVGDLAENNLIRMAEENTLREARHLQSMAGNMLPLPNGRDAMQGMKSTGDAVGPSPMENAGSTPPNTMELLISPEGLPGMYQMLVEGLNVPRLSVLDLSGMVLWSSDQAIVGEVYPVASLTEQLTANGIASQFVRDQELTDFSGVPRRIDVMEMYLPIPDALTGDIVGIIEADRDVSEDVVFQVDEAKRTVLWITFAAMGGLFLLLLGFILVADRTINRSRRRELAVVEEVNQTLEARVLQRTQELQDAQDQLVRSEKLAAIGQLAGGVAHDLRNPLGAIKNAIYYLEKKLGATDIAKSNPRIGQFLQIAEEEVEHSNAIISDLMSFARVGVPSLSATNLEEVVGNVLSTMKIRENVQVIKQFDPDLPQLMADAEQLYRVFINLTNNAQEAMPNGGQLTISTQALGGYADVVFQDTGVGISEEDFKKIFEPLFTTKTKGTGLGLAVSQQIVAKHGGTIQASSTPGEGTTFTVRLPLESHRV